jgi:preprotein translocase subunit SecG
MYTLIIGFIIFLAFLLVIVVLAQNSKGGGLTSQFGGSGASNMFGVKKTGDFLEKATWVLIALIMVLALSTNFTTPGVRSSNEILDAAGEQAPAQQPLPSSTEVPVESAPADSAQ